VAWLAPGAIPPTAEGNDPNFVTQVLFDQTLHVTMTVCNKDECADPVTIDLKVIVDPATTISLESCGLTSSSIDCLAAVSTSIGGSSQWTIAVGGYSQTFDAVAVNVSPVGMRLTRTLIDFRTQALSRGAITGAGVYQMTVSLKVCKKPDQPDSCISKSGTYQWVITSNVSITSCGTPAGGGQFTCNAAVLGVSGSATQWALSVPGFSANFGPAGILAPGQTAMTLDQALASFRSAALAAGAIQAGTSVSLTVSVNVCAGTCTSDSKSLSWIP